MNIIYNFGIQVFGLAVRLAAIKNAKASLWLKGRKGLLNQIKNDDIHGAVVWVHCASLGEFEQGRPLIEELKLKFPEKKILLTFYSPSGYEVQKKYKGADYIYYMPLDSFRNAKRFVSYIKPEMVFFIKYEFWYNYLCRLNKANVPVYFVSSIFRKEQLFFKWYGGWYRKMLKKATHFFVQTEESANLLKTIQVENSTVVGDTRFDRVAHFLENLKPVEVVESFIAGFDVIVAGSTWRAEDAMLAQYVRNNESVKVILAPHEVNNENIDRILSLFGEKAFLYSDAKNINFKEKQVMVVDCYGILSSLYQYGTIGIIGGGFGVGIHNILEAATYGMPIVFGPNYHRFKEAIDLVDKNCAFGINNIEEFNVVINHLLRDKIVTKKISNGASMYVMENIGATQKIIEAVF